MEEVKLPSVKKLADERTEYNTIQFIVIKLGNEQYGIDIKFVDNIVRMQHITDRKSVV